MDGAAKGWWVLTDTDALSKKWEAFNGKNLGDSFGEYAGRRSQ